MTILLEQAAARTGSPDILSNVLNDDCNLAIWERAVPQSFKALVKEQEKDVRFDAPLKGLLGRLAAELNAAGVKQSEARADLIDDIAAVALRYCNVLDLDRLQVRLEVVTTNSCRKWHADYVKARLITTYAGSGTDWLDADDAARVKNGDEPLCINSMRPGDVGIFKGLLATNSPAIHRSPPIAGSGEQRLLLVLNPADEE